MIHDLVQPSYIIATILFILALHWMNTPQTARRGVYAGVVAMLIAVVVTWIQPQVVHHGWIIVAIIAGLFGFTGVASGAASIGRVLFGLFLVVAAVFLVLALLGVSILA